jgi:hypothetical protein
MFEGNTRCTLCEKELGDNEKNFGISMRGYTYVFCDSCFKHKKDEITGLLHD